MADLNMENYFITAIKWQPHEGAPLDRVGFGHDQEEQNEAIETLIDLLGMEERAEDHEEEAMVTMSGPKRMEVELKQISTPTVVRKLVVTTILPPKEHFKNYSVGGRLYKDGGSLEKFRTQSMSSDMWQIAEIREYPGGFSSPATTYYGTHSIERRDAAWEKIVTFLEGLKPAELTVIGNWECKVNPLIDDDEDDLYGYGSAHYTQRVPNHYQQSNYTYKPPVAMLRTAGDEVGEVLHLDTCELEVQRPDDEREMDILEYLEKKVEAETEENPEAEVSAVVDQGSKSSGDRGSSGGSNDGAVVFCDCGSPSCEVCEEISLASMLFGCGGHQLH